MNKAVNIVNISLIIVQNIKKEVLLLHRPENVHCPSCWSYPGGKVKNKESFQQAAQRELYEETNIITAQWHNMARFQHDYPEGSFYFHLFHTMMSPTQTILSSEKHLWFSIDQLHTLNMPKANKQFLDKIYQLK
ncbi:MAG: NUDIX domain-containing protein [Mariprofundaceae bacterium]|nr:NUDIX domain-containing protein [Mariprofundaceae bacterium]